MPSLRETQLAFASSVLGEDCLCMQGLVLERGFSTAERMRVYRNNAQIGFHQALRATYPVVEQLGGSEWFESLALRFQRQHPSRRGDLQYVGESFAPFLRGDLSGSSYEWFADVARLEWAWQEVLVAPAGQPLDPATLAPLTPEQQQLATFTARPDLRLIESAIPVLQIWRVHQSGAPVADIAFDETVRQVMVLRRTDHVELRELPPAPAFLLGLLRHGLPLGQAQQQLADTHPAADFGAELLRLVQLQALGPLRIPAH